jgi:hypothetical protein
MEFDTAYENHIHWVNDMAVDTDRGLLFSASSDTYINIWKI